MQELPTPAIPVHVATVVFVVFFTFAFWYMRTLGKSLQAFVPKSLHGRPYVRSSALESSIEATMANRTVEMAAHGFAEEWTEWNKDDAHACLTGTTVRPGMCDAFIGGIVVDYERRVSVRLFDWHFALKAGKSAYVTLSQTGAVVNSIALDLPAMTLRPLDPWLNRNTDSYLDEVETPALVGYRAEFEMKRLGEQFFQTPHVSRELIPYLQNRDWSMEWTGDTLLVYQQEYLVPPNDLCKFADDVAALTTLLHEVEAQYSSRVEQWINASVENW